ncbi:hypothetical protein An04g05170 [Aspergillus niger]|uniref:Uncharacterized protein n=2 Tax=Aspergillus niger TaxID=5061 RepID=A2QIY5_ASPNC|nr:hypothetical protein An04g05170 [Aspergillus niger]CAK38779.1 hypothetical protein An04g05170 [Aspergillus niger]
MYPQSLLVLSQGLGCPTCILSQTGGEQHIPPGRYQHPRHNVSNYSQKWMSASFRAVVVDDDGMIQATDELDPYDKNLFVGCWKGPAGRYLAAPSCIGIKGTGSRQLGQAQGVSYILLSPCLGVTASIPVLPESSVCPTQGARAIKTIILVDSVLLLSVLFGSIAVSADTAHCDYGTGGLTGITSSA